MRVAPPTLLPTALLSTALALVMTLPVEAQTVQDTAPKTESTPPALPAITVVTVSKRKIEDHILASGLIGPVEQVLVPPLIEGQPVESLLVDVGDMVTAGQVLATLSQATLILQKSQLTANGVATAAAVAQAEAQLTDARSAAADARKAAERSDTLFKQGLTAISANDAVRVVATTLASRAVVAEQSLASARAQLDVQAAQMANIDLQLNRTQIVAPVSGQISARNAQIGGIASAAGQPLFTIIRDGALELSADVAETDLARLAPGLPANMTLASGVTGLTGTIRLVAPTIDATTRLGNARISIDPNPAIRAGMFASADILLSNRETLAIPVTAVGQSGTMTTVKLVKDSVVSEVEVKTGIRQGGWVEVLSGLSAGDAIVAKAGAFIAAGDKVNPIPSEIN
ncbi:MAG: efflux RND transporter periplasmic adaptor subunit [Alphaproteobacteria bacterium]